MAQRLSNMTNSHRATVSAAAAAGCTSCPTRSRRPEPVHPAERRMRDSGGPDDRAVYTCLCGYLFEAAVTASVTCPHCGVGQAW